MRAVHHTKLWLAGVISALTCAGAAAFDHNQFCEAMSQFARANRINVGTWIDRTTRNDGVEIFCDKKIVHFKRTSSARSAQDAWKQARTEEWRGAYCTSPTWREAIENGWVVSATVTTAGGERVWFACQRDGSAFHRVMP